MSRLDYVWLTARIAIITVSLILAVIASPWLYNALWRLRMRRKGRKAMQRINAKYRALRPK